MSHSWRLVALVVVGSVSAGAMTGAHASAASASNQARGPTGTPDCGAGAISPWPRRDIGRIVAKAEVDCTGEAPQFPHVQIRLKLQRKKPGTDGWVTKSFAKVSPPTPTEYFLATTSRPCKLGKYRTSAKFLYRWDAAEPWSVLYDYLHSPPRDIDNVRRCQAV